jgi:D-aspartate ligase
VPLPLELDTTVPVLVLKIGRYVIHHGTLGIIRSLGRLGVPVYAIIEDRFTPAATCRYLAGSFVLETEGSRAEPLLTSLITIARRLGRRAILIPTDDLAAAFVAEHPALEKWFLSPRLPRQLPRLLANKKELHFLCRSSGVPFPDAGFPQSLNDVHAYIECARFPVMVKAAEPQLLPKYARSTCIARDAEELISIYRHLERAASPHLIFQEYIPESCAEDWIYHGYSNPQTGCLVSFTGRKLRSYPPFTGITTLGIPIHNEALRVQSEKLIKTIGYAGIMDLDYRLDKRDGQYKLLDFNPRIGANFRMFEDSAGVDVVRALHLDLTGRTVRQLPPVQARTFVVQPYDFFAAFTYMRRGGLTVRAWLHSMKGRRETAWFQWDDPFPFFTMCMRLLIQSVHRGTARTCARWANRWVRTESIRGGQPASPGGSEANGSLRGRSSC